jgi:hypothetical protein
MAVYTIDVQALASPTSSVDVVDVLALSGEEEQDYLPDITHLITPYMLKTFEMFHKVHGSSDVIKQICLSLSFHHTHSMARLSHTRPTVSLEHYNMKHFTDTNPLPSRLPFIGDHCAAIIPNATYDNKHHIGVMDDIIEAMRQTTLLTVDYTGVYVFVPPTTQDIQNYLSIKYPNKYPGNKGVASGWRNTVNQCLTHGQGWNFLTFPPTDGSKNKRHLLFERAFNGSYVVGSGQCKGLNDLKPKNQNRLSPTRRQQLPTPPTSPVSTFSDALSSSPPSEWSLECMLVNMSPGELSPTDGLAAVEAGLEMMQSHPESGRSLAEVEVDIMRMLNPCYQ